MRKFASPGFNNSPPFYPRFNMARDFACDFTGSTLDTPAYIDIKPKLFCISVILFFFWTYPASALELRLRTSTSVCLGMAVTTGSNARSGSVLYRIWCSRLRPGSDSPASQAHRSPATIHADP